MTSTDVSPRDQELIAAFIDRRLSAEERQAFMRRLDAEEALYEVFVETVRYRDQESGRPAEVVDHPAARRRWGRWAAAAALAAAALTPLVLLDLPGGRYAERLVADGLLGDVLQEGWLLKSWATMRGGPAPGTDEFDTAFRLGVRQVDREVALRLGRADDAAAVAGEIDRLLAGLEMGEVMRALHRDLPRAGAADALERAETFAGQLREFLGEAGDAYELGQWTEAGILAARGGNVDLLASRSFRRAPRRLPLEEWAASGNALADRLAAVEDLLDAPPDELDLVALERAFTAIVDDR